MASTRLAQSYINKYIQFNQHRVLLVFQKAEHKSPVHKLSSVLFGDYTRTLQLLLELLSDFVHTALLNVMHCLVSQYSYMHIIFEKLSDL